jgi:hypothetical protein
MARSDSGFASRVGQNDKAKIRDHGRAGKIRALECLHVFDQLLPRAWLGE